MMHRLRSWLSRAPAQPVALNAGQWRRISDGQTVTVSIVIDGEPVPVEIQLARGIGLDPPEAREFLPRRKQR